MNSECSSSPAPSAAAALAAAPAAPAVKLPDPLPAGVSAAHAAGRWAVEVEAGVASAQLHPQMLQPPPPLLLLQQLQQQ